MNPYFLAQRFGPVWLLLVYWDDNGLHRRSVVASSPDPRAITAARRLLGGEEAQS